MFQKKCVSASIHNFHSHIQHKQCQRGCVCVSVYVCVFTRVARSAPNIDFKLLKLVYLKYVGVFLKSLTFFLFFSSSSILFEKCQPGKRMCGLNMENHYAKGHHRHLLPTAGE